MKHLLYALSLLLLIASLAGCASMSKQQCESADWRMIGYGEGSRGIDPGNLQRHRDSCGKYHIVPDDAAYRAGWEEGIRRYCTADTGYRAGSAGQPYPNICPPEVEAGFMNGWQQGIREYCTPDNGLHLGLAGTTYRGSCPAGMAEIFQEQYRLGRDVRGMRSRHRHIDSQMQRIEQELTAKPKPERRRDLMQQLAGLRHEEQLSDAELAALETCMSHDWFDAGLRAGSAGQPERSRDIAASCRRYGVRADRPGYRNGWRQGNSRYCTYDSGLDVGRHNREYLGVCSGFAHRQFWRGYQQGQRVFDDAHREPQPKPAHAPTPRQQPPAATRNTMQPVSGVLRPGHAAKQGMAGAQTTQAGGEAVTEQAPGRSEQQPAQPENDHEGAEH